MDTTTYLHIVIKKFRKNISKSELLFVIYIFTLLHASDHLFYHCIIENLYKLETHFFLDILKNVQTFYNVLFLIFKSNDIKNTFKSIKNLFDQTMIKVDDFIAYHPQRASSSAKKDDDHDHDFDNDDETKINPHSTVNENLMDESSNANYSIDDNDTNQQEPQIKQEKTYGLVAYGRVKHFFKDENSDGESLVITMDFFLKRLHNFA